jgi:hypothetical protein
LLNGGLFTRDFLIELAWQRLDDFCDFTFINAVRLFGRQNPDFFEGTPVADAAAGVLANTPIRAAVE